MNRAAAVRTRRHDVFSWFIKIEEAVSMVLLAAVVLFVFCAAVMRTIGYPIIWSVDIAQVLFIWVCLLGANQALRNGSHVGVDYFVRRLPIKVQILIDAFTYALVAAFLVVLVWYGVALSLLNPERVLGSIDVPYAVVTLAIPFGGVLMLITTLWQTGYLLAVLGGYRQADFTLPFMQKYQTDAVV